MMAAPSKPRHIELILRQIDSLPTLPAIAARLLSLTASDTSSAREVIDLIRADPPLTAKVLSLCKAADKGLRSEAMTIDRAVVLLGFDAIRNAVLSVKVLELGIGGEGRGARDESAGIGARGSTVGRSRTHPSSGPSSSRTPPQDRLENLPSPNPPSPIANPRFDLAGFWTHSLAVGILAERIAAASHDRSLDASQAFVCGLLHDIGKLALHHVLPKSYERVIELTELNQGNIAEYERRILGIDHHTAGKRLAEQWRLPYPVLDCIWLHGSASPDLSGLPRLEHQRLIGLIALSDLLTRRHHVGASGNHVFDQHVDTLISQIRVTRDAVDEALGELPEQLDIRGEALGLNEQTSHAALLDSFQRANLTLGRMNDGLEQRSRSWASQARVLEAISAFHATAMPGQRVQDVLDAVVQSAHVMLGRGFYAMLCPGESLITGDEKPTWLVSQYGDDGKPTQAQYVEKPPYAPDLKRIDAALSGGVSMDLAGMLPWVADYLVDAPDLRQVRMLPLACGWGTAAILLHDRDTLPPWSQLQPLISTWGAAVGAAGQHEGARLLGEELAQANSALFEAQDRLLRQESMARLGEMAAGAAHEMNNPLAVICGRSQLLGSAFHPGSDEYKAARAIREAAQRLSDLITNLRMFADPPQAARRPIDLGAMLDETIKQVAAAHVPRDEANPITLQLRPPDRETLTVHADEAMLREAVMELLINALQARGRRSVQVVARVQTEESMLMIQIIDDGEGMDAYTLSHATDPFFSAKAAGRRVGLGLPRARQLAAAHGGDIQLTSTPGKGTTASLSIPLD